MERASSLVGDAKDFYDELKNDPCDRYRSWEHCYSAFNDSKSKDVDYLSLQLAFYLASWGMYRGSSFLLEQDYRIHIAAVKILLDERYSKLRGISCDELCKDENLKLVERVSDELSIYYKAVRCKVYTHKYWWRNEERRRDPYAAVSSTLITKVLMGTLGCCPAYDQFFIRALKELGFRRSYSINSLKELAGYYQDNEDVFETVRKSFRTGDDNVCQYPQMKVLDMAFWMWGKRLRKQDEEELVGRVY